MTGGAVALGLASLVMAQSLFAETATGDEATTLAAWWPGIYDTSEQVVVSADDSLSGLTAGSEVRVHTLVSRVALNWLGDRVLYAEEFLHDNPEDLRRQVLLRLEPNRTGGVRVTQYTLRDPSRFRHLHRSPRMIANLRFDDLETSSGCDLVLRREIAQFTGGTEGNACRSGIPDEEAQDDATYVDYRLLIGEDLYWYRRRHFRVYDNELISEVAGYTWFQLYDARLFSCKVQWSATGKAADRRELATIDIHDQGGRAHFETPDKRLLEIELHGNDWPFAAGRDALILMLSEQGGGEPIASAWANIDTEMVALDLDWIAVSCAAVVPREKSVEG